MILNFIDKMSEKNLVIGQSVILQKYIKYTGCNVRQS